MAVYARLPSAHSVLKDLEIQLSCEKQVRKRMNTNSIISGIDGGGGEKL